MVTIYTYLPQARWSSNHDITEYPDIDEFIDSPCFFSHFFFLVISNYYVLLSHIIPFYIIQ